MKAFLKYLFFLGLLTSMAQADNSINRGLYASPDAGHSDLLIISATYGSGTRYSDVTHRVTDLLRQPDAALFARPGWLSADPTPGWNKALVIVYEVGGHRHIFTTGEGGKVSASMLYDASGADSSLMSLADGPKVHSSAEVTLNVKTLGQELATETSLEPVVMALRQQVEAKDNEIKSLRSALASRLSLNEIRDLRPGSMMLAVTNGMATLHLKFQQSNNLTNWSNAAETTVEVPADAPVRFFRYRSETATP